MRRVLTCLLAAALFVPGPAHAAGCAKKGSGTAASTRKVRVYWGYDASANADKLYGCVRTSGITRVLYAATRGIGNHYQGVAHLRVNRYRVAFSSWAVDTLGPPPFAPDDRVVLADLRTGRHRVLRHVRDHESRKLAVKVDGLVLDRCGRIAYLTSVSNGFAGFEHPDPRLLTWIRGKRHLMDRRGAARGSFHFSRDSLRWAREGAEHLTTIRPAC